MKIESTDQDIRTMLSSGYYKIPRFQRPYSWESENVQEFWDDVVRDNPTDYFIGSMVVYKEGQQRYGVVDGQQRLTTLTILLCVLRDKLSDLGFQDLAEGINSLVERRNIDNKPEFIVSTESSYPYFQDQIQTWGKPSLDVEIYKEEENLSTAFEKLKGLVSDAISSLKSDTTLSDRKRLELSKQKLISIRDSLLNLKVIFIKLEDEDDAYMIFETLNTRGKDLSLTDLVKNHVTKHLKSRNASSDQAKVKWEKVLITIEGSLVDIETDNFIHHYWLSKYDYLPAKKLFKVLKKRITADDAQKFLNDLVNDSALYRTAYESRYGKWSKQEKRIEDALDALSLFRVQQQIPCVLSLLREYKTTNSIKKKHLEEALIAIEKFHFFFTAVTSQRSSGGISAMYASLGRRLYEANNTQEAVKIIQELKLKLRERVPGLPEVKALFPNIIYTDNFTKLRRLVKYTLREFHKAQTTQTATDYEQMTIEHLIPQSQIGKSGYSDELVGQLGNLILVPEKLNNKLRDKPFSEKKSILLDNGYKLPADIKSRSDWGPSDISTRTNTLADQAFNKVWKI